MTDREARWNAILDRLPPGWRVSPPSYDPGARRWEAVAIGPSRGSRRSPPPAYIIGTGPDELAALRDLARRLA
jgi:hypothetical protein